MENSVPDFVLFLGRFHPLVVHLPIGFLFFAFVLEVFSRWKKNPVLTSGIPLALLLGGISGAVACILGYMLSLSGDYDAAALDTHFWFGIATTAIAFLAWLIRIEKIKIPKLDSLQPNISSLTLLVILLSVTGHYGGNLTHGSDYLTKYLPFNKKEKKVLPEITKVEDAVVFDYLAQPILEDKCISCHNSSKKKGGLSLQDSLSIFKGGKNGKALIAGNAHDSEMIKRVLLDKKHEDVMPPEGKTLLTEEEIAILKYWIDNANADFSSKIADVETPEDISGIASTMLGLSGSGSKGSDTPLPVVNPVTEAQISAIQKEGFSLRELVFDSGLYEVVLAPNTITKGQEQDILKKLETLLPIKENIVWLSLEENQLTDESLKIVSQLQNIQKLKLNNNPLSDSAIPQLVNLKSMTSLNLYGTQITAKSLETISEMNNLKHLYVWKTNIKQEDIDKYASNDFLEVISGL